jgi:redox-sensitive bicupin YhaK (pirin superfamily)
VIKIARSDDRGTADHGWLKARHTFSFADYYNPAMMGFGSLRVINEDRIEPGKGFGTHPHQDMEIVTYIIDGALEHKDSMGNGSVIRAGDVQRMTAGTGVRHSEFNHSSEAQVHLLQIWILPEQDSLPPGYEEQHFPRKTKLNQWRLIASRDARDTSLRIHQDLDLHASIVEAVVGGSIDANGESLAAGDGAMITDGAALRLTATAEAELLLFDIA